MLSRDDFSSSSSMSGKECTGAPSYQNITMKTSSAITSSNVQPSSLKKKKSKSNSNKLKYTENAQQDKIAE